MRDTTESRSHPSKCSTRKLVYFNICEGYPRVVSVWIPGVEEEVMIK